MSPEDRFPEELAGLARGERLRFRRRRDCHVIMGEAATPDHDVLARLDDPLATIVAGALPHESDGSRVRPVYGGESGADRAVPTGRVFVRTRDGRVVAEHADVLAGAGYAIERVPDYAPDAAWLLARSGDVAEALAGLPALVALDLFETVEPQLLRASERRA